MAANGVTDKTVKWVVTGAGLFFVTWYAGPYSSRIARYAHDLYFDAYCGGLPHIPRNAWEIIPMSAQTIKYYGAAVPFQENVIGSLASFIGRAASALMATPFLCRLSDKIVDALGILRTQEDIPYGEPNSEALPLQQRYSELTTELSQFVSESENQDLIQHAKPMLMKREPEDSSQPNQTCASQVKLEYDDSPSRVKLEQ